MRVVAVTLHPQGPKPTKRVRARKPIARKSKLKRVRKTSAGAKARTARRAEKRRQRWRMDAYWAKQVRQKYGDGCFHAFCGQPATDTHHIIGKKAHPELRYVVENGAPMCREHHDEAHARPKWFKENFRGWYHARWCSLQEKAA